ncbi:GTP 3',8-cyclase [archaeon HR01]|nr:GTP 3',8-cyclase [archaeon HR01]
MYLLRELVLDITNRCPMLCLHCSANSTPYLTRFIPFEKATHIIEEAVALGLEIISFTGGEPLLHPQLLDMIRVAKYLGVSDVRLFTSGLMYDENKVAKPLDYETAKRLRDAGLDKAFFNLQGASPKIHEAISLTPRSFDAVVKGSRLLKKLDVYVGLHFVPMKLNWRELPHVVSLAKELDVDEVGVLRFVPQGRGLYNRQILELNPDEFKQFLEMLAELIRRDGKPYIRLGCPFNPIAELIPGWRVKRCPAADEMCHILIDGTVAPCSAFKYNKQMSGGNIYSQSLTQIWRRGFTEFTGTRSRLAAEYSCTAQKLISHRFEVITQ